MDEQGVDHGQQSPQWVPYTPPAATGWERVVEFLRRIAFPLVVLLLGVGVVGLFYWGGSNAQVGVSHEGAPLQPAEIPQEVLGREVASSGSHSQLTVYSSPSGATVRMNGDSIGVTPVVDHSAETGPYLLSLQADGYFRRDTVMVLTGARRATIDVSMRPRPGSASRPGVEEEALPSGTEDRTSRALPRTSVSSPVPTSRPGSTETVGSLYVTSVPSGAVVRVKGRWQGRTPVFVRDLAPGSTKIAVSLAKYATWSREVEVGAGSMRRIHADLRRPTGRLRILVRPWGNIYLNGALQAREQDVWYETSLPAGGHELQVIHPDLGKSTQRVRVTEGGDTSVVIDLRTKQ